MMDGSSSHVLDQAVCDSCKHLFTEKDKIIDDLKRNLQTHENRVQNLENEVKNLEEQIGNVVAEKEALEEQVKSVDRTDDKREKDKNLEILQDQLKHLEEEKKYLDEKIHDFEHETAGLARMFGMQQEKFEHEMKNKDNITGIEKERERLEGQLETTRSDLGKLKKESELGKELVENLKMSIQEKDEEFFTLSHLHDDAKKLFKELEEKFSVSDENLKNERSKNKMLEENVGSYMDDMEILSEENGCLKTEINHLRNDQRNVSEDKSRVEIEIQKLNDHIECLQNAIKESQKNYVELEECDAKLKQDKNDKEFVVRKLEKNDVELRTNIENLKKEIVLVTDQKHALESKMSLVQAESKNVERVRERLGQELLVSRKRLEKAEENLQRRTIEKGKLEQEVKALEQVINDLMIKNKQQNECLEKVEENLEKETKEKEKLEEEVKAIDQMIIDLKNDIKQQKNRLEETKRELDTVVAAKQQLLLDVKKLEDVNKHLKIKINTLSQDIENMHGVCDTKAKKLEDLERTMHEKSRIILSHERKEKELQSHVEELLNMEEICANELKNAREEITKLRKEKSSIEENYGKVTVQFQQCLKDLSEKDEMYMKSRAHNEKQIEELSRFRELNTEINDELRKRNDEVSLLTMEKDELLKELESKQNLIENNYSIQSNLNKEVESMKLYMEKSKENEKETLQKLSEANRKRETAIKLLDNERDEKNDLELQLKYSREKGERWKKLSFEIKEERNRLQVQIAEMYRDLNEKHSNLAEEKSSLVKEMETLKNVVKRLKSNEENLRGKIEELRDEVDKLSDINSEQEMEIRRLTWEKERMTENLARLNSVAQENATLQNECKDTTGENMKLKNDIDTLDEKATNIEDENERLQNELKIRQDQFDVIQARVVETTQECKQLKNECNMLKDNISELMEEKERLFNENCRLKENKNSIMQDRNKLQDMIESLDKCHSEKNDALSRQNTLLENELESRRLAIQRCGEKESKLLNERQELNEKIEKSMDENDMINGLSKKTDGENIRLRKKVADLAKVVEQIEQERELRVNLETESNGKEQLLNKYKENKKKLNDLISTLYRQQNDLNDALRNKERELIDLNNVLGIERSDKLKCKDTIQKLEEELKIIKTREIKCIDEIQNEKENNELAEFALTRVEKERNDLKETSRRNENECKKKIQNLESETCELLNKIEILQNDIDKAKLSNENLDITKQNLEEEMCSLTETKCELLGKLKNKDEQLVDLAKENNTLKEESRRLKEHVENIDRLLSLQNFAALDQASGMEKEIRILHDTLAQLQNTGDINRSELDELRRKLKTSNEDRIDTEVKLNDIRLEREKLESKNAELLSNCARLENLVKEGVHLKFEKKDKERLLETEQRKNRVLDEELAGKTRELLQRDKVMENLKKDISDHKEMIEKLDASKKELITSVEELTQINDEGLKEFKLTSEKNEQLHSEKNRLIELVAFHKDEIENLKRETDGIITELQFKIQEAENEKFQLQSEIDTKEESLHRLTEKNNELQESLKNVKEEVDELENENDDLLAEVEQLKEVNKKAKEALYTLQTDRGVFEDELREKENNWNEEKGKISLEIFKMETDVTNLNDRLTQANERNEKQRELEKMLRLEIDELSDGYVELEEEVQHRNDENLSLKEKLQTLSQDIEELELARDTACLLKEKRHCELLKSEKNVQRLEKHLKEKQKTNTKLQKELDSVIENEKFLELQISSEKELSGQRLKHIQDLQNSQRKVDEQLWKAKRDIEKLGTEIETWRTSGNSMKVRIETLEDELNKTANEKQIVSELYQETKKINETKAEEIITLKSNFFEKTTGFETIIGEMNNEKYNCNQKLSDLEELLDKRSVEIATLEELVEAISNKYEDSLLVTSLLHNDIQIKDERIADLEERKKRVTNLLSDLDLKIAEIQVQAVGLETDNESLRQQLIRAITSEKNLRRKLEDEQRIFVEKYERSSLDIQHLQELKDHYSQLLLEANCKIEDQNSTLMKLQEDYEKLIAEKLCLNNTNERLEKELLEVKSEEEKLTRTLNTEKEKTLKQSLEIEHFLKECESLKAKCSVESEEHKETGEKLMNANTVCQELEDLLEERNAEILKIREHCENWNDKANQLEESLSISTAQNEKLLQMKNEEIRSLTAANRKLKNVIDEVKSELEEQTIRNDTNEFENKSLKEKLEQKQERFNDLEVLYQNTINSIDSLEVEKKGLLTKIKSTSRNLETLNIARQQLINENKELNCVMKAKENELEECCNAFKVAEQRLDEEIFDHKTTLENLLVENNDLRQKVCVRNTQVEETKISLEETSRKLEDQEKENKRLNVATQNLTFERNCLADVNLKVSDALGNLKNESGRKQTRQGNTPLESETKVIDEHGESANSWQSKQVYAMKCFELQNNFSQVENEIRTLRSLVSNKESEITRLEVSLDLLQNEMDVQCSQISNHKQNFEDECKRRENALDIIKQLEADLEHLKEEKHSIATESQEKIMRVQQERLANELVICDLRGKNDRLVDKIRGIKTSDEEKTEQIKKLENMEITRINELEAVDKIMETTFLKITNLEETLFVCGEQNDSTILCGDENNRMNKYDELFSTLMRRFERVLENIQSQLSKAKKLEKDLTDTETRSSIYQAELQASQIAYRHVKVEFEQSQNQLSLVTCSRDEALCKVAELSESLLTGEENMERTKNLQNEENSKISQELQKMQRELSLACEKFNCSISKARSLEENIRTKGKRIAHLEEYLKISAADGRMLQIRVAELETTAEILSNTNKELENTEKEYEEKIEVLRFSLEQEKAGRNEDNAERAATIRQLELKNENSERQVVRSKELLSKAEKTTKELQNELETLQSRYNGNETASRAEIQDCQSKILQLKQNILNLEDDTVRLENDSCALAKTNEYQVETITKLEKENMDYRDLFKQNNQEKEMLHISLGKVFDIALNEEVSNDINDQSKKLERVIEVIKDLNRCKEALTKEKKDALENVLKLKKENEEIHVQYQTNCMDYELLKQRNSKLTDLIKNLENDLDLSQIKCEQLNTKVEELEENVETLKVNEEQQQYQYHVLEKEKEGLENEVICIEEGMEKLTKNLNESVHLLNEFHSETTGSNLDDSGIGTEENSVQMMPNRNPLDSGVFTTGFDTYITFPPSSTSDDEKLGNEKMGQLETAVNTCVQMMSKVGTAFSERSKFYSVKEQQLIEEIRVLKQTSVQNEDLLSSLEDEVERLELSQKSLQETYQEKDANLKECQMKLEHSLTIAEKKEMSIKILNESVQENRKQYESFEKDLNKANMANEQLNKEKLQTAITVQDYEKAFEKHRQRCLEIDAENEKITKSLRSNVTELENRILEKQNANLELQDLCATLRGTMDQLNNREKEYLLTITSYQHHVQDLEKQKQENTKQAENLSQELDNNKQTIVVLETMRQETQESANDLKEKLQKTSVDLKKSHKEVIQLKERNIRIKLERDSLTDEAKIRNEQLKEKKSTIENISSELREKDELLTKNETKLKLVKELLQEINKSKDNLEKCVNELKEENGDRRKQIEVVQYENKCLRESLKIKEEEVSDKQNLNYELDEDNNKMKGELLANSGALKETMNELRMSLAEGERINNVIDDLNDLFDSNAGRYCSTTDCQEGMATYNQILSIGRKINNLSLMCQKILVEREMLQKNVEEKGSLLEHERSEKSTLAKGKQHLDEKITALSRAFAEVKLSLRKQGQELGQSINELSNEKKRNDELHNVNLSLQEQVKLLEDDVLSISAHAESLKGDRKNLKESLMNAQNQVAILNSKYEQLDVLNEALKGAKHTINELNNLQDKTITAKENAEKELKYTQQRLTDLETSQIEQSKLLSDTQVTLTQERERIETLTKLARMKEYDLEKAKMAIKLKDELIGQMKEQIEEMKDTSSSTKEELAKAMKQLATIQQRKETLSNEKVSLWKDCAVLKDGLEQIQKEKQALEMKLDNETKRTSMTLEKLEKQKQIITELRDEVKLQKHQCEQLEKEKSKLTNEAKDKEKRFEMECAELLEKSYSQNKSWDSILLHLKSELSLSESLRNELEKRIAGNEVDLSALEDKNLQLQAEIETCCDTIKELSDQEKNLLTENKYLEESVKNISDKNKHLKNCYEKVQQRLEIMKTTVADKDRENNILQKKMLSGKEIVYTLRNVALNSKSEMNDLRCQAVENTQNLEKVNKELEHERNTVWTLTEDKTELDELYRLSQNLEANVKKDLEDARLQINDIRNENLNLRKENTSLHCKLQQEEKTINDLKFNIQTLSVEKLEINNMLTETRRGLEQANEDLHRVCSTVAGVGKAARTVLNEIHANVSESHLDIYSNEEEKNNEPSCFSLEPCERSTTDAVFEELGTLEMALRLIDSLFKQIVTFETTLKNKVNELTLVNKGLSDQDEKQEEKARSLQESQKDMVKKSDRLETQNKELAKLCEKLQEECKRVEELLSNECTITTEISKELSTLKYKKQRLCEKNNELEISLDQCVKENDDLNAKQGELKQEIQAMCEECSSLERRYATLCQEKREIDETALKRKEQVLALENDLEASVEFSEILEKRLTEEGNNSTRLRLRVETLDSQVCGLEDNLKTSLSRVEDMNSKVVFMNEEIRQTGFVLCEKEKEISRLHEELTRNDEKLKNSSIQVENYKTAHEDVMSCKKETDEKLQQTELLLERSEKLLHQEKQLTNDLTIEKDNIEKELQSTIMMLQERVDELVCELSAIMTNEQTTKEDLDSARDTIKQLENEVKEQLLKMKECGGKRKTKEEELDNLKLKCTAAKAEFDTMRNENEELHEEKQELQKVIERLEAKITLHDQDREKKLKEIENLEIQFADEQKAKQVHQSELSTLQKDLDSSKKQNSEQEKQIKSIMESKTAEVDSVRFEKKNLEQRNEDISQEMFTLCQSLVKDLKSTEFEKSCDHSLLEDGSDSVTDLSKMIGIVRSSHTLVKDQTNLLNTNISELNKRLKETGKENETLLIEKTHLEDVLCRVQKESDMVQVDRNSLIKALETSHHDLELKSSKIQALEDEIDELQQQEKRLKETIEAKEEEYIVLHTKKEVMEKKRVSLEEEVGRLQSKLGNAIIELTTVKSTNEVLESKNNALIFANSCLLDDHASLQNKLNEAETQTKKLSEKLSLKENEISRLKIETSTTKKQRIATEKSLEEKESELTHQKDNLKELERQKYDLENEMNNLREHNKQIEKGHKDLQLMSSQIQADNYQLKRELECERTENVMKTTSLQCDLEKALTSLEKQNCKLSQVQNEKEVVQNQLLEAEKELTVLMEDNANLKHEMYQSKTTDKDELLTIRCQVSESRHKIVALSKENKYLADQLREKSAELRELKVKEQKVTREMENNREKMRRYLNDRDKWEEEVKSVISEIGHQTKSESTLHGTIKQSLPTEI